MGVPKLINLPPRLRPEQLVRRLPVNGNFRDRTGEVFERCTVLGYVGTLPPSFSAWLCRCHRCGKQFVASSNRLNRQNGCGCHVNRHGLAGSLVHRRWQAMIRCCYDVDHPAFVHHGGLGICVCRRWRHSPEQFAADMGEPPNDSYGLRRINPRKDFTPRNCQWAPRPLSQKRITHNGETLTVREWAEQLGISRQAIELRLKRCQANNIDLSRAVSVPQRGRLKPCGNVSKGRNL